MTGEQRRVALVTGANKGIGFEIVRQLAQRDLLVLLGARDAGRGQQAAAQLGSEGLEVQAVKLDITDEESVARLAENIRQRFGRLDVLVNNAGLGLDRVPPSQLSLDELRRVFETNVFGAVRVIQGMLPLLRAAPAARIVNMGSGIGSLTAVSDPDNQLSAYRPLAYAASKAALHMVTVQFANELRAENVLVNAAEPGFVATEMTGGQGMNSVEDGAAPAVRLATLPPGGPTATFSGPNGPTPW